MRGFAKIISGGAALAALAGPALAQGSTASATATGSVTIVQPLTITKITDLGFGAVYKPINGANIVTVAAVGGARTLSGTGNAVLGDSSGVSSATFGLSGEGGQTVVITVPRTFDMLSGANTVVVTTIKSATSATLSGSIGTSGTQTFSVGGAFQVARTTNSGAYTGNFVVTVAYN